MITVIIPTYNYARFLPDAINSVLAQTYSNWKLIIIDSSSTDNTAEVLKPFLNDVRITYQVVEKIGVSYARNVALAQVETPFIQFLDADDWIEPQKFELMLQAFTDEIDLIYSEARYFRNGFNTLLYSMHLPDKKWMPCCSGALVLNYLIRNNIMPINAPIFRTDLIRKFGFFDTTLTGLEDWELWLRFAINGSNFKCIEAGNIAAVVRIHATSASTDLRMMHKHILPVLYRYKKSSGLNLRQKLYLNVRCFESFWDGVFAKNTSDVVTINTTLKMIWIFMLPVYLILKLIRFI
ncbi:MAG: glycosyltransferase [Bacteroidia bacterium]|nr:glycosyltransferase [Bacteroidia bacterium]HQV00547.1 glycosyltransferase [Bacteroidia bacterium]